MACLLLATAEAAAALRGGAVLILETDTLPGLHAVASDEGAVGRIIGLKARSEGKPLLLLASSLEQVLTVTAGLDDRQMEYCRRSWPGPFTLILPAKGGLGSGVTADGLTLAVRVPDCAPLRELIAAVGFPLVSTSVNVEGRPPSADLKQAVAAFGDQVDGAWGRGRRPDSPGRVAGLASALIDLTRWPPVILRTGPQPPPEVSTGPA